MIEARLAHWQLSKLMKFADRVELVKLITVIISLFFKVAACPKMIEQQQQQQQQQ